MLLHYPARSSGRGVGASSGCNRIDAPFWKCVLFVPSKLAVCAGRAFMSKIGQDKGRTDGGQTRLCMKGSGSQCNRQAKRCRGLNTKKKEKKRKEKEVPRRGEGLTNEKFSGRMLPDPARLELSAHASIWNLLAGMVAKRETLLGGGENTHPQFMSHKDMAANPCPRYLDLCVGC